MSDRSSLQTLLDYWVARIQKDLAPFSDPGTEISMDRQGRTISTLWSQRAEERQAVFHVSSDGGVTVTYKERVLPYRAFFASTEMADLLRLAKMTLQSSTPRPYVATKARLDDEDGESDALTTIRNTLKDRAADDATLVLMITGDAGAGKTSVLQELVRAQAEAFTRGQVDSLFLYVNAQGRALARFTEAVAAELDDLRSRLTFHEVTPLVRLGLLVPVIDGFDELLGVSGYDEAYSSLAAFIEELDGSGQLIASARSTYYEQEFLSRTSRSSSLGSQYWKQATVRVQDWHDVELRDYVNQRCDRAGLSEFEKDDVLGRIQDAFSGRNEHLASKPFFVARTLDLLLEGEKLPIGHDLLESLVETYLRREQQEKLLDRSGKPILTALQVRELLVELAEEMWNQETRELDARSVREVAGYILATEGLDEATQRIVIERMPTMAFLAMGERRASIAFEHETFFAFFLAQRLADRLASATSAPSMLLGRSVLPADVARICSDSLLGPPGRISLADALSKLSSAAGVASPRRAQTQENAGLLAQSFLKTACSNGRECPGVVLADVVIPGGDLAGVSVRNATLHRVELRRVDLTQTKFEASKAHNVMLFEVVIDPQRTRLELAGLDPQTDVMGLRVVEGGAIRPLYDPSALAQALMQVGALPHAARIDTSRHVPPRVVELLERFTRAYRKANPLCTADDMMRGVFQDPDWKLLQKHLIRSGVVSEENRHASGQRKVFLRRQVLPDEIMAGLDAKAKVPEPVTNFWQALEADFL